MPGHASSRLHGGSQTKDVNIDAVNGVAPPQPPLSNVPKLAIAPHGQSDVDAFARSSAGTNDPSICEFWNVNVPRSEWTDECPEFLQYALENEKDRGILATPDHQYVPQTWDEVQAVIRGNRLDLFKRVPSQLRLYREYCHKLINEYGSIMNFVVQERLHWRNMKPSSSPPFSNKDDFVILYNDWPYGVDERIVHLVVWTKFELPVDPKSEIGDMTTETRQLVDDFVDKTFVSQCGRRNVIWFKNWGSLKSIHAVEHFHVMLWSPDPEFIRAITNGDIPLFKKVQDAKQNGA